jgi:hypothetical protein
MYEHRWHRWAAPAGVALTTTAGAAYLPATHDEHVVLGPQQVYAELGYQFGGGTATVTHLPPVVTTVIAGTATAIASPPLNLRWAL